MMRDKVPKHENEHRNVSRFADDCDLGYGLGIVGDDIWGSKSMSPLQLLPRFRAAQRAMAELEAREQWSRDDIEAWQLERLNELWAHAIRHVPYYRQLSITNRLPESFASLSDFQTVVPILDKDLVRTRQTDFLSAKAAAGQWHLSGGSTGVPTSYFRSNKAHLELLRGRYRFHAMWGIDLFDRWVLLWGHASSFAPGLTGRIARINQPILDRLRKRLRLSAYDLGTTSLRRHLQSISRFRPAAIYAYSTAAYLLAREAKASKFRCPSLKLVVLTAEPAFPHIVEACEQAFGVPVVAEYGSSECSVMAVEWPDRTLRVREDFFILETLARIDGRYDIVVTVLNSESFPIIRYGIGDVTDAPLDQSQTGFAILKNVSGRQHDLLISREGQPLLAGWFEDVLEHNDLIRRFQIHQQESGDLVVTLELNRPDALPDVRHLKQIFEGKVGFDVQVRIVEKLSPTTAGKHRWITSALACKLSLQHSADEQSLTTASLR